MSNSSMDRLKFSVAIRSDVYQKMIYSTLGDPDRAKRFVASVSSAVGANPALQECDAKSIVTAALLGESLNLSPSPQLGQYYMVPFENKLKDADGKTVYQRDADGNIKKDKNGRWMAVTESKAQFVLGYKGYIQLALRSGQYADIDVLNVKEGEYKGRDAMTGKPKFLFIEDDATRDELPTAGYLAYFEYLNGFRKTLYMTKEQVMAHADRYSPAFSSAAYRKLQNNEIPKNELWKYSSPWYSDFDTMAHKTLLRRLISKWGVMSVDLQRALEADEAVVTRAEDGALIPEPAPKLPPELIPEPVTEPAPVSGNPMSLDDLLGDGDG